MHSGNHGYGVYHSAILIYIHIYGGGFCYKPAVVYGYFFKGLIMEQFITFLLITAVFYAVFHAKINKAGIKAGFNTVITCIIFICITVLSIVLHYTLPGVRWFYPAAWIAAVTVIYGAQLKLNPWAIAYFFIFGIAMLSFCILPYNIFTPYIFLASGYILLLIMAEINCDIMSGAGVIGVYFFTLAAAFTVKLFILGYLPPWISVPVSVLAALFIILRNAKGLGYYTDEKNGMKLAAIIYVVLILQCFAAAMLKNPVFK